MGGSGDEGTPKLAVDRVPAQGKHVMETAGELNWANNHAQRIKPDRNP
jgi:hypothetical protein